MMAGCCWVAGLAGGRLRLQACRAAGARRGRGTVGGTYTRAAGGERRALSQHRRDCCSVS